MNNEEIYVVRIKDVVFLGDNYPNRDEVMASLHTNTSPGFVRTGDGLRVKQPWEAEITGTEYDTLSDAIEAAKKLELKSVCRLPSGKYTGTAAVVYKTEHCEDFYNQPGEEIAYIKYSNEN